MDPKKTYVLCSTHRTPEAAENRVEEIKKEGGDAHVARIVGTHVWTTNVLSSQKKKFCKRYQK